MEIFIGIMWGDGDCMKIIVIVFDIMGMIWEDNVVLYKDMIFLNIINLWLILDDEFGVNVFGLIDFNKMM